MQSDFVSGYFDHSGHQWTLDQLNYENEEEISFVKCHGIVD